MQTAALTTPLPQLQPLAYPPAADEYGTVYFRAKWADNVPAQITSWLSFPLDKLVRIHSSETGYLLAFGKVIAINPSRIQIYKRLDNRTDDNPQPKVCPNCSAAVSSDTDVCPACNYAWQGCLCVETIGDNRDCPVHAAFPEIAEDVLWRRVLEG